jgi:hypothetical protein
LGTRASLITEFSREDALDCVRYIKSFPNRDSMPQIIVDRVGIKLLTPDLASVFIWTSFWEPNSKKKLVQSTMKIWQKFDGNWKIVGSHSNNAEAEH